MRFLSAPIGLLVLLLTAACDDTFTPIEASALRYSLYGYLDASADTQWIRVMPVRPLAVTSPEPLEERVTLEHLGTHRVVELRDSLFRQTSTDPELGGGAFYYHNFWTVEPIDPGATYRLTVTKAGSPAVETLIKVPPAYDLEILVSQRQQPDLVHLTGLEHVGLVFLLTSFRDICGFGVARTFLSAPPSSTGERHVTIPSQVSVRPGCNPTDRLQQDIQVIGSGEPWPTRQSNGGVGRLGEPGQPTLGESGIGFLAGVLSRDIPYEDCRLEGRQPPEYCRLRYEEGSASLRGTITDTRCGTALVVREAIIELREVEPESPDFTVVRPTTSGLAGGYLIRGLTPGKRYALLAKKRSPTPVLDFIDHTDTLVFVPNEVVEYDIDLERRECPP
jgi:hypothetical protein